MPTYEAPDGPNVDLGFDTVDDLLALAHITRRKSDDLARQAIEQLRNTLVPSTKEAPARAARAAKGAKA